MTFIEYGKQEIPKRRHFVQVGLMDCYTYCWVADGYEITLMVDNHLYTYLLETHSEALRTIDSDGNPTGYSCFNWAGNRP